MTERIPGADHLRLAFVFDGNFDAPDGVPNYMRTVGEYLTGQGVDVHYIVGKSDSGAPSVHAVGQTLDIPMPGTGGNRIEAAVWPTPPEMVRQTLEAIGPLDVMHVQVPYGPVLAGPFMRAAQPETAVTGTFHTLPLLKELTPDATPMTALRAHSYNTLSKLPTWALGQVMRPASKRFDAVSSTSPPTQIFARESFGLESEVIANPVDLEYFRQGRPIPKYNDDKTNIVFLGRLVERKGVKEALTAIACLDPIIKKNLRFLIGGKGKLREPLEAYARNLGLMGSPKTNDNTVEFLGFVPEEQKADLYATADINLLLALGGESFGIVLAEAMAAAPNGRRGIVISSNLAGYGATMQRVPDAMVDPSNPLSVAATITRFISDSSHRATVYGEQQQLVKAYDIKTVGPQKLQFFMRAIEQRQYRYSLSTAIL